MYSVETAKFIRIVQELETNQALKVENRTTHLAHKPNVYK
jgi:hypothetical protein